MIIINDNIIIGWIFQYFIEHYFIQYLTYRLKKSNELFKFSKLNLPIIMSNIASWFLLEKLWSLYRFQKEASFLRKCQLYIHSKNSWMRMRSFTLQRSFQNFTKKIYLMLLLIYYAIYDFVATFDSKKQWLLPLKLTLQRPLL